MRQLTWILPVLSVLLALGCSSSSTLRPRIYRMGERVEVPPLIYNVLQVEWRSQIGDGSQARVPANRFLIVHLTVTNSGGGEVPIPPFTLESLQGQFYPETIEAPGVPGWLGVLRKVAAAQTEEGRVVFDAPVGAYRLRVSDGGEPEREKFALVEIPVEMEGAPEVPFTPAPAKPQR